VPTAKIDGNGILEDATSPVTGDVLANDTVGADAPAVFVGWPAQPLHTERLPTPATAPTATP